MMFSIDRRLSKVQEVYRKEMSERWNHNYQPSMEGTKRNIY